MTKSALQLLLVAVCLCADSRGNEFICYMSCLSLCAFFLKINYFFSLSLYSTTTKSHGRPEPTAAISVRPAPLDKVPSNMWIFAESNILVSRDTRYGSSGWNKFPPATSSRCTYLKENKNNQRRKTKMHAKEQKATMTKVASHIVSQWLWWHTKMKKKKSSHWLRWRKRRITSAVTWFFSWRRPITSHSWHNKKIYQYRHMIFIRDEDQWRHMTFVT